MKRSSKDARIRLAVVAMASICRLFEDGGAAQQSGGFPMLLFFDPTASVGIAFTLCGISVFGGLAAQALESL